MFPHNNEGRDKLLSIYDHDSLSEIASHGCKSGVCSQHIYYGDTISFFDKYEGEILDLIHIRYGVDTLVEMFREAEACYDHYRNDCCWLFIENVATDYVIGMEDMEAEDELMIEEYMRPVNNFKESFPEMEKSFDDVMNLSVYNPPQSMNLNRYSNV